MTSDVVANTSAAQQQSSNATTDVNYWKDGIYYYTGGHTSSYDKGRIIHIIVISDDITVTEIGQSAFSGCHRLRSIDVPKNTIRRIQSCAFEDCFSLTHIHLPNTLQAIECETFANCLSLESIKFSIDDKNDDDENENDNSENENGNKDSKLRVIGEIAFQGCRSLKYIDLPNSIKVIGSRAFSMCTSLESIIIPSSAMQIGRGAFSCCEKLSSIKLSINDSDNGADSDNGSNSNDGVLDEIQHGTFVGCKSLKSIIIPNSVRRIGVSAFDGCFALSEVTFPSSFPVLEEINESAFEDCESIRHMILPSTVHKIGSCAFNGCQNLISIHLPDQLEEFGWNVFDNCPNLRTVVIGNIGIVWDANMYFDEKIPTTMKVNAATTSTTTENNNNDNNTNMLRNNKRSMMEELDRLIHFLCDVNVGGRKFITRRISGVAYPIGLWPLILNRLTWSFVGRETFDDEKNCDDNDCDEDDGDYYKSEESEDEDYDDDESIEEDIRQWSVIYYLLLNGGLWK